MFMVKAHESDIGVPTTDIRMTYACIRETYEYIGVTHD